MSLWLFNWVTNGLIGGLKFSRSTFQAWLPPPEVCRNASASEATYRPPNSPNVQPDASLEAHYTASIERARQCETVILVQDTTIVDLTKPSRQVKGAGPREAHNKFGFYSHPLYAIDSQGISLGFVVEVIWFRDTLCDDLSRTERTAFCRQACCEEKESCRWLEMFQSGE
jgi:hypothetical protein